MKRGRDIGHNHATPSDIAPYQKDSRRYHVRPRRREVLLQCLPSTFSSQADMTNSLRKRKRGRPDSAFPHSNETVGLKADAQTELNLTRRVDLPVDESTPVVRFTEDKAGVAGIEHLIMVEHVCKDGRKLHMEPLGDHDVLLHAQVHVVERHASKSPGTTIVSRVYTQDRVPETVVSGCRIRKEILADCPCGVGKAVSTKTVQGDVFVARVAKVVLADENGVLLGTEVGPVGLAEGLAAAIHVVSSVIRRRNLQR